MGVDSKDDAAIYANLEAAIKRRCPAMLAGLPPHWMLRHLFNRFDSEAAKSAPYKCGECGRRHLTSDKRNACCGAARG